MGREECTGSRLCFVSKFPPIHSINSKTKKEQKKVICVFASLLFCKDFGNDCNKQWQTFESFAQTGIFKLIDTLFFASYAGLSIDGSNYS